MGFKLIAKQNIDIHGRDPIKAGDRFEVEDPATMRWLVNDTQSADLADMAETPLDTPKDTHEAATQDTPASQERGGTGRNRG